MAMVRSLCSRAVGAAAGGSAPAPLGSPLSRVLCRQRRWMKNEALSLSHGSTSDAYSQPDVRFSQRRSESSHVSSSIGSIEVSPEEKPPLFDTFEAARELQRTGLDSRQSEAIMRLIDRTVRESTQRISREYIPRSSYSGDLQRQWQELEQMRRQILIMEKTEIFTLRNEVEKAKTDLQHLRLVLEKDMGKVENGQKLDISLQKAHIANELQKAQEKVDSLVTDEVTRAEHHFAAEVKKQIAEVKLDAYKTLVALMLATGTLMMTYLRFFPVKELAPPPPPAPAVPTSVVLTPAEVPRPTVVMESTVQTDPQKKK